MENNFQPKEHPTDLELMTAEKMNEVTEFLHKNKMPYFIIVGSVNKLSDYSFASNIGSDGIKMTQGVLCGLHNGVEAVTDNHLHITFKKPL